MMNKQAGGGFWDTAQQILKGLATIKTLQAILIGGGAGWLMQRVTAPRKQDIANVQKQMQAAVLNDSANKLKTRFNNEVQDNMSVPVQRKSMRI